MQSVCRLSRVARLAGVPALFYGFLSGCALPAPHLKEEIREAGRFEFRESATGRKGVVIAAPHGTTEQDSDRLAISVSDRTGAGLVVAYGFKSRRLGVAQPVARSRPYPAAADGAFRAASVFTEYTKILRMAARGELQVYIGIHKTDEVALADRVEVATSGLTYEQARALKESYLRIQDRLTHGDEGSKLALMIEPLDRISWRVGGVKHHGVLLFAQRGLDVRLPPAFGAGPSGALRSEILSRWIEEAIGILRENPPGLPRMRVRVMDLGRFEVSESRNRITGIVVGAPHGSFDRNTAEMVKQISYLTGIASVVAKGFTPTEAGGWRINVNRPTEKTFPSDGSEVRTPRAREVYRAFRSLVLEVAGAELKLYVDVHRYNTGNRIQVATVGIGQDEARILKGLYYEIRDRHLPGQPGVPVAEFAIEPLEEIALRASGAKSEGILSVAEKGLHFELPSRTVFATAESRDLYARILADLMVESLAILVTGREDTAEALSWVATSALRSDSLLMTFDR
ncbi:MAG: hypothetical protein HYV04_06330 [Deltaproteobacteria bacterium]|nr:hypothetical protein [Deltaproteobacteria bacterium]